MPITRSAKKAMRHSLRKKALHEKKAILLKKTLQLYRKKGGDLSKVYSLIDKASQKGIIHPNKASRLKSAYAIKGNPPSETKKFR